MGSQRVDTTERLTLYFSKYCTLRLTMLYLLGLPYFVYFLDMYYDFETLLYAISHFNSMLACDLLG